jgi:hypothetical protein
MKYINWFISCFILIALFSCSSEDPQVADDGPEKRTIEIDTNVVFESERFEFILPQPFALITSFEEVGLTYHPDRTNPVENVSEYTTRGDQLINFGVYSADLIYCIINEQPQQSILYFNAMKTLAEKFGMGAVFTENELAIEIEKNITNRSELEGLLIDVHERSQEYLEDNQLKYLSAIQFSGAWVEGMYLASFDFTSGKSDVGPKLIDQMSLLKNTIIGLQMYEDRDVEIDAILNELKAFETIYANFDSVKSATVNEKPTLTKQEIKIIAEKIAAIRNLIIS